MSRLALFVTGSAGQVGSDLQELAVGRDDVLGVRAVDLPDLDITDAAACREALADFAEWAREADSGSRVVLVNCAAWTNVDGAEANEAGAFAVNAVGPAHLARASTEVGAEMIHISTDYVFDGAGAPDGASGVRPYEPDDPVGPINAYGRTKLAGEWAVRAECDRSWVVRTAWVYGLTGGNFVKTIARLLRERESLAVVDDQRGTPTWSRDLAASLLELAVSRARYGTYHLTGAGETTWYGFARAIAEEIGVDPRTVEPTTTDAFPRPAVRPQYSVLSHDAWVAQGLRPPRPWREALAARFAPNA